MSYMDRLKAKIAETRYPEELPKLTKPGSGSFGSDPDRHVPENSAGGDAETSRRREVQIAWREGIALLDPEKPRGGFHWRRWDHLVADCVLIFNEYGEQAAATGWTAEDLFGVDPAGAAGMVVGGLALRLQGRRLLSVGVDVATFKYHHGEVGRCSKGWIRGLVPVWELGE